MRNDYGMFRYPSNENLCYFYRYRYFAGMSEPDLTLKNWMDARGISAEVVAAALDVGVQTVKNWRSIGVPERRKAHVAYFMDSWHDAAAPPAAPLRQTIIVHPTVEQFRLWNRAAISKKEPQLIEDWALQGLDYLAKKWEKNSHKPSQSAAADEEPHLRTVPYDEAAQDATGTEGK